MVVLIDSYYLEQNKASEDKEVSSLIYKIISDMKKYSKCVIIFDLDSISFIKEEYSGLKEHL
jgi:5'-3' exonuclease